MTTNRKNQLVTGVVLIVLLAITASAQTPGPVRARNAVGLTKVDIVGSNQLTLLAVPFTPVNTNRAYTLDEVLGTNLHAGASATVADQVWVWDGAQRKYNMAFLGDGSLGWQWSFVGADSLPHPCILTNLFNLRPTVGFFVQNKADSRSLFFTGDIPVATVTPVTLTGIQMLGHPYPIRQPLGSILTTNDGAQAHWSAMRADQLWLWNSASNRFDEFFLADASWGDTNINWRWCSMGRDGRPYPATNTVVPPGMGYFYKAQGSGFNWQASKPFIAP
ncbi:MAG: hypothetical protein NTY53_16515 [Kiritimatiellaeota bacterium]|nr:hypothetical protein [Kiritimatiellota bacterium]